MYKIYDNVPFGIIVLKGESLTIEYLNCEFKKTFDVDSNVLKNNISEIKAFDCINEILKKCFENKLCKKLKRIKINNKYFDIATKYNKNIMEVFTYDVTDYVDEEIKIKKSSEKLLGASTEIKTKYDVMKSIRNIEKEYLMNLKDVINNISEGIIVLDKHKKFSFCNKAALEITEVSLDEIKNFKEFVKYINTVNFKEYGSNLEDVLKYSLANLKKLKSLIIKIEKNGKCKYIDVNCNYVVNNENKLIYVIMLLKDITETKINEIMIKKHSEELERITQMKDEFFSMISHELRTPLTVIYSSLELADDIYCKELTPNIKKILLRINQNCSRLLKLINNILDISKAEAGFLKLNYSHFNIVSVTENIISSVNYYAKSKQINLIFDTNMEDVNVKLDKDKYEKIILNLLSNAIKFTPNGKNIWIILHVSKSNVSIKVKDEGIGIPKNKINKIFDRFAQINNSLCKNTQGTGLGLALVKEFTNVMGGKVLVSSVLGTGTEFTITFINKILIHKCTINPNYIEDNINNKVSIEFSNMK